MPSPDPTLVTHDGLRLHVTVRGREDAPVAVLLAHCWTADEDDWHYQVHDLLSRYGHDIRIVTWDHRGHGRSDAAPEPACTVENVTHDMGAVIDRFAPSGRLVLAGHSLGGFTISALADQRRDLVERIAGLLFVATSSGGLDKVTLGLPEATAGLRHQLPLVLATRAKILSRSKRQRQPLIERQIARRYLFGDIQRPRDVGLVVDQIINCAPATMSGYYKDFMTHHRSKFLESYDDIPTTVLVGSADLLTPPHHSRTIASNIRGARLVVAPGAGHMLPLERPELVTDELFALVDRAVARAARESAEHEQLPASSPGAVSPS